jgi:membrane-bound serine protease (ClpP class)
MTVGRIIRALLIGIAMLLPALASGQAVETTRATPTTQGARVTPVATRKAVVVQLEGEINDFTFKDMVRRFREADQMGAQAIVLEINSYGGAVVSGLDTSRFIKQQNKPVIAFVKQKAISAGVMIAMACDGIYMAPHSAIGDSAPIAIDPTGGLQPLGAAERAKIESPIVEDFRDSAIRNGYSPLLAEAMVVVGREVYYVQNKGGEKRFVDGEEYARLQKEGGWEPVIADRNPIDSRDSLLTVHAEVAKQIGLSRGMAASAEEVAGLNGWKVIGRLDTTAGDQLVAFLASGAVRSILMILLVVSIFTAIKVPGTGLPEAGVAVCLALLLGVPLLTGYAQWWEVVLVLVGVVLLALEIFVLPGHAVAGIVGVICILVGLVMTFVPKQLPSVPGVPSSNAVQQGLQDGVVALSVSLVVAMLICYYLAKYLPHSPIFGRLILRRTVGGGFGDGDQVADAPDAVAAMAWVKVGDEGEAFTDLCPGGIAQFEDRAARLIRSTDVISDSGFIARGTKLRVHEVAGSTVVVRVAAGAPTAQSQTAGA